MECKVEGCDKPVLAKDYCSRHYQRWRRDGDPGPAGLVRMPDGATCSVDGCDRPNVQRGYCEMHRWRVRSHGDAGPAGHVKRGRKPKEYPICAVNDCTRNTRSGGGGYCRLHFTRLQRGLPLGPAGPMVAAKGSGSVTREGYRRIRTPDGRRLLEHVYVMEQHLERRLEPGENVHHRNGLKLDNRIENLELWVKMQPTGQRVEDLVAFVVAHYPELVRQALG